MKKQLWPHFVRPRIYRHRKFLIYAFCLWVIVIGAMAFYFLVVITEYHGALNGVGLFEVLSMIFSIFYFPVVVLIFIVLALLPAGPQLRRGFEIIIPEENKKLKE